MADKNGVGGVLVQFELVDRGVPGRPDRYRYRSCLHDLAIRSTTTPGRTAVHTRGRATGTASSASRTSRRARSYWAPVGTPRIPRALKSAMQSLFRRSPRLLAAVHPNGGRHSSCSASSNLRTAGRSQFSGAASSSLTCVFPGAAPRAGGAVLIRNGEVQFQTVVPRNDQIGDPSGCG